MSDTDFGTDILCGDDLDPFFGTVSGRACLIQDIHHRYQTTRGSLIDDPNYGLNVGAWSNETATPARLFALEIGLSSEALKDERVLACSASVTFVAATNSLSFTVAIEDAEGPFDMVFAATSLSVDLLSVVPR